jgi:hypothetical protein
LIKGRNRGGSSNGWDGDSVLTGTCYDESGKEIKYTPFYLMPILPYDMNKYLSENIHYLISPGGKILKGALLFALW